MDKNTLLVVVDMQRDFLTGSLANEDAVKCIPAIREAIKDAGAVIFTRDTHHTDYLQTQEGRNLPVEHCIEGTDGHEVEQSLIEAAENAGVPWNYINKNGFGYGDWGSLQLVPEIKDVVFCGTCTDICVISNVVTFKTAYPEIPVKVLAIGCAGINPERNAAALEVMKSLQVEII